MSGKVKMRCARCSRSFKSVSAKQTLCPECEAKERAARAAGKLVTNKPSVAAVKAQAPVIVGPGAGILVPGLANSTSAPATETTQTTTPGTSHAADAHGTHTHRQPTPQQHSERPPAAPHAAKPRSEQHSPSAASAAPAARPPRPARQPKAPREQTPPFVLTDEMRVRIETRYQELAQPLEFDGIRTQIAAELGVPKQAVKRAVSELRSRLQLPSWWELQAYTGSMPDLERIRAAYLPHLPLPPVGIHKQLSAELGLDSGVIYQGIRRIRAEMRLPQYNPPEKRTTTTAATANDSAAAPAIQETEAASQAH